jgi:hypothetical protein
MKEIEYDDLLRALQVLIQKFAVEIVPFAAGLVQRLAENFFHLLQADEEDDNSALAASECLVTIETILISVSKLPDVWQLYAQIEPTIMPLLVRLLSNDCIGV